MTGVYKNVLALGLLNIAATQKAAKEQQEVARAAGFEIDLFAVRPDDERSLEELREVLRSKKWDVVTIGFGVRGNSKYTSVFEKAVNMCIEEVSPPPKLGFSTEPQDIIDAIKRVSPA